jgi:hypothetical protein
MTDAAKLPAWDATWKPWGEPDSINGSVSLDARFPGQWFPDRGRLALQTGIATTIPASDVTSSQTLLGSWMAQPFYGYALGGPQVFVDPEGLQIVSKLKKIIDACIVAYQLLMASSPPVGRLRHLRHPSSDRCQAAKPKPKE